MSDQFVAHIHRLSVGDARAASVTASTGLLRPMLSAGCASDVVVGGVTQMARAASITPVRSAIGLIRHNPAWAVQ